MIYTAVITNRGVEAATNVSFALQHSPKAAFLNSSLGNCSGSATVNCTMGMIPAGTSIPVTYTLQLSPDATGILTSSVSITTTKMETITSNNTMTTSTTIAPLPTVRFSQVSQTVYENVPTATVTVTLDVTPTFTVTVNYDVVGATAVSNTDYTLSTPRTITFSPSITTQIITISIIDNNIWTGSRTLNLQLSQQTNAALAQANTQLTLLDDDKVAYQLFLPYITH